MRGCGFQSGTQVLRAFEDGPQFYAIKLARLDRVISYDLTRCVFLV